MSVSPPPRHGVNSDEAAQGADLHDRMVALLDITSRWSRCGQYKTIFLGSLAVVLIDTEWHGCVAECRREEQRHRAAGERMLRMGNALWDCLPSILSATPAELDELSDFMNDWCNTDRCDHPMCPIVEVMLDLW